MNFALMMLIALALDVLLGWPDWLFAKIGHPVTWIGRLIDLCERRLNRGTRSARIGRGAVATAIVLFAAGMIAVGLQIALPQSLIGSVIGGVLAWPFSAAKSLHGHVAQKRGSALFRKSLPSTDASH